MTITLNEHDPCAAIKQYVKSAYSIDTYHNQISFHVKHNDEYIDFDDVAVDVDLDIEGEPESESL